MKLIVEITLPQLDASVPQVRRVEAGQADWKFASERQSGELYYRTKLQGNVTLSGDDYRWLYTQHERFPCCVEINLRVFTNTCAGTVDDEGNPVTDQLLWQGYFNMAAVRWNHVDCKAEVQSVNPRDGYDALYRVWETPINLLAPGASTAVPPAQLFYASYGDYFQFKPNPAGQMVLQLPDGNNIGTGPTSQLHLYPKGYPLVPMLTKLLVDSTYGTPAGRLAQILKTDFYTLPVNPVTKRPNLMWIIMAGSDAKRPASVTPAVKLVVTLKEMLEELKALHNVWHIIDPETGLLRLEHYSWFAERSYVRRGRVTLNLLKFPENLAKANNESVDLDELYAVEELVIANNASSDVREFRQGNILFTDQCVVRDDKGQVKTNTRTASRIYTDLLAGYKYPESVPDEAIFLGELAMTPGLGYELVRDISIKTYKDYALDVGLGLNGFQSAAMLMLDYHRHGVGFSAGRVNAIKKADGSVAPGLQMAMLELKPTRRQEGITVPVCCADFPINLDGYVRTNRFELAKLAKISFDPVADTITLDVLAGSRCQVTVVDPQDPGDGGGGGGNGGGGGEGECAPAGLEVSRYNEQTYCSGDPTLVLTNQEMIIYTDGNCGTYELPGKLTVYGCD
ncbi:hypothetical protein DYU11_11485 [Fibrisoma montanum]|uniref:Uncharacterized protein n=1 Tax=Fibrisoma montanum TaxID=2305895 RepID=A0A418MB97_9BACT|nr:hypothetical protein [Fibrisoma montanum]RIV23596.1 hypothetical protein DYU11_11485 [Fibrisoma montanum]